MNPNTYPSDHSAPASGDFPVGFVTGMIGGMALYYLAHTDAGKHLKAKLLELYEDAQSGATFNTADLLRELETYAAQTFAALPIPETLPAAPVLPEPPPAKPPKPAKKTPKPSTLKRFFSKRH